MVLIIINLEYNLKLLTHLTMKNIFSYFLLALIITSCTSTPKTEYILTGKISGIVPEKAVLQLYEEGEMKIIDSAEFKNGE